MDDKSQRNIAVVIYILVLCFFIALESDFKCSFILTQIRKSIISC